MIAATTVGRTGEIGVRPEDRTEWDSDLRTGAGWTVDEALDEAHRTRVR